MTNEEYIEIMDKSNFMIDSANPYDIEIKEALERQIPKKPKYKEVKRDSMDWETGEITFYYIDEAYCSSCNEYIGDDGNIMYDFCPKCGQAIKLE